MKSMFSTIEARWRNIAPRNPTQTNLMRFRRNIGSGLKPLDLTLPDKLKLNKKFEMEVALD